MIKKIIKIIFGKIWAHKIITLIVIAALGAGGYFGWQKLNKAEASTRYITGTATTGLLISSISGTGQVSASNQIELKPEVSGRVYYVGVKEGQSIKAGAVIAQLDATDALKSVRDAQVNLETAQLSLEKLMQPTDALTIMQAENDLEQTKESLASAENNLKQSYDDGFNAVANAFLNLPTVMTGLENIIYGNTFNDAIWNLDYYVSAINNYDSKSDIYKQKVIDNYKAARAAYEQSFANYKATSRYADDATIENLINETYETTKIIAESIKETIHLVDIYKDLMTQHNKAIPSGVTTHANSLDSYTGTTNSHLTSLLSKKSSIVNSKNNIVNYERSIKEKTEKLADLQTGPDELDLRSQKLAVQQKENALVDARAQLADYTLRAPFAGVIVNLDVYLGQTVSAATVGTLMTNQKIAEVTLNEIDAAQVSVGQKATLSFDAVSDLTITGEVVEVDAVGAVTQGVVSYGVKVAFDVQDERVKPGMSVGVQIITDSKQNVLMVPVSAVKSAASISYVEILENGVPARQTVTTGMSNDTMIEITDGLAEGDEVVTQTVTNGGSSTSASSAQRQGGQAVFGGGMMRVVR